MRPTSYFSVVRYVADPVRNEPRNIGVIVISPQHRYAKGRFALARTGLASTSPKFDFLRSIVSSWDLNIANQLDWLAPLKKSLDLERLRELHTTSTNVLQFTDPLPVAGDPDAALDATYRDFVMPKGGGGGGSAWTRGAAIQIFRRSFGRIGLGDWIKEAPPIRVGQEPPYVFDLGVGNGKWQALIENITFRNQDPQRPEERAAWMSVAWPSVHRQIDARGLLFIEGAPDARARVGRVTRWAQDAGIEVLPAERASEVAAELATEAQLSQH